jgi:hypothetical protein
MGTSYQQLSRLNPYIKVPGYIAAWVEAKYADESGGVEHCLGLIVTNLLAYGTVAYARHRPTYTTPYSNTTAMLQAVGHLVADGYATSSRGYKNAGYATGVPSTLTPAPKLVGALAPVSGVEVDLTALPVLTVDDKPIYKGWQLPAALPLTAYTTMVKLNRDYFHHMALDLRQLAPGTECLTVVGLTRMYTKEPTGTFGMGRLHQRGGPSYQQLTEEQRAGLLLNGEAVKELDYPAMHPHILYAWEGLQCPEDFYESIMAGCGCSRFIAKKTTLIALNASQKGLQGAINSDKRDELKANLTRPAPKPILYDELKACGMTAGQVVRAITCAHPAIAKYLFTQPANRLMMVESEILIAVLLRLMELYIPALPLHDSLIVPVRCGVVVRRVMGEEYHKQTGFSITVA